MEDVQQGAFNNEGETLPAAYIHTLATMEMKDFEVQKGLSVMLGEAGCLRLLKLVVV